MTSKRNIALTLTFLAALLISILLMQQFTPHLSSSTSSTSNANVIVAFADNIIYKSYNKNGFIQSNIKATSLERYQKDGESSFKYPHGLIYTKKRIPWYIRADTGRARDTANWIYLHGNVIMHQLPYPNHPETTIKTETAIIHPAKETAETDQAVLIQQLDNEVKGVGMKADMNKGIIDILSQSEGYYQPTNS